MRRVGDIDLGQERPRARIEGAGGAGHRARHRLHELTSHGNLDGETGLQGRRVHLRDIDEHAEGVDLSNLEKPAGGTGDAGRRHRGVVDGAACRDQRAHIHVPLDDRAVEGGEDALERGHLLEALDVRPVRLDVRFCRGHRRLGRAMRRDALIQSLLGHRAFRIGRLVARHRDLRQIEVGLLQIPIPLRLLEIGPGLPELLLDLG